MRLVEMPVGTVVVLRGWRTVPNSIRLAKVIEHVPFAVEVEYLYGDGLPMDVIVRMDGGPQTESPSAGQVARVKLGDCLRVATPEDHDQELFEWEGITSALDAITDLREQGVQASLLPEWPVRIQVNYTVAQIVEIQKAMVENS